MQSSFRTVRRASGKKGCMAKKIILDMDPGVDDALASFSLCGLPNSRCWP
jgi:hypothetical protein